MRKENSTVRIGVDWILLCKINYTHDESPYFGEMVSMRRIEILWLVERKKEEKKQKKKASKPVVSRLSRHLNSSEWILGGWGMIFIIQVRIQEQTKDGGRRKGFRNQQPIDFPLLGVMRVMEIPSAWIQTATGSALWMQRSP